MNRTEQVPKTVWTTDGSMAYYNLPPYMVQHWTYVHELNGALTELVKILTTEYRILKRPLNPLASPYIYEKEIERSHKMDTTTNIVELSRKEQTSQWTKIPPKHGLYQVQKRMKPVPSTRAKTNRFKELEEIDEDEEGIDTDEVGVWESDDEERRSCDSKVSKSFDVEKMSTEELDEALANNKDECRKCNEMMDAYEGLVCEYHRIAQYAIEQESEAEHLGNINHYMLVMNYLEMNERKAQRMEIANIIDEHNIFRDEALENGQGIIKAWEDACEKNENLNTMYEKLVDDYNELVD